MGFIHDDFLLRGQSARRLYHEVACDLPILDYHTHLPAGDILEDAPFRDLHQLWLAGDHYKWRAMRANGVPEHLCTGDADPREKFHAWARTVPATLRNPLHHWTHLELKRFFDIDTLLDADTADTIWEQSTAHLATTPLTPRGILRQFRVSLVCTTNDPLESLDAHHSLARVFPEVRVLPTFRPDRAMDFRDPAAFPAYCDRLAESTATETGSLPGFLDALRSRHAAFHEAGCRLSDHGLPVTPSNFPTPGEAARVFDRARHGGQVSAHDAHRLASLLLLEFGRWNAEAGWTQQLHLGARRDNNSRQLASLGHDTGFDSVGDWPQAAALAAYLDRLDSEGNLPRVILYNLNPADNPILASLAGCFQDGRTPGKIQLGPAWWFLDQKDGIAAHLDTLSRIGLIARFIGMVTDSRSFLSVVRHEYFRRILCNLIGTDIENGEIPDAPAPARRLIADICHHNAEAYLRIPPRRDPN